MEISDLTLSQLLQSIKESKLSVVEVTEHYLQRIDRLNKKLNAVVLINDRALEKAKKMDQRKDKSELLFGLPVGIKDLFCSKGIRTTAASKILHNFIPPYSATCVEALESRGAFVLAKTNMDEFAMGSSNEASYFGECKNPWGEERVPGGSSGGSAAAVSSQMVPVALGSDTGGSIRQPSHFCGITGIKPTYGSISRYGMVAFASSLDQAGPMGRSVEDCALLLEAMIAQDDKDSTTLKRTVGRLNALEPGSVKGKRIGLPREYFEFELDSDIKKIFDETINNLRDSGAEIISLNLPHTSLAVPVYYLVATSEASSNLSRYDGVRYGLREVKDSEGKPINDLMTLYSQTRSQGFGEEVKRRILLGTFALSSGSYEAFYQKACQVRRLISEDFSKAFKKCDFILSPVSASTAFKIGEKIKDPVAMYFNDILTTPGSLAGLPSMSLPIGLSTEKLPIGLQIMAPPHHEDKMISLAKTIERMVNFKGRPHVW